MDHKQVIVGAKIYLFSICLCTCRGNGLHCQHTLDDSTQELSSCAQTCTYCNKPQTHVVGNSIICYQKPLVPEIVCGHGGPGITPHHHLPLWSVQLSEAGWGGGRRMAEGVGGRGLRMDNKYAVNDLVWVRIRKSLQSSKGSFESKSH